MIVAAVPAAVAVVAVEVVVAAPAQAVPYAVPAVGLIAFAVESLPRPQKYARPFLLPSPSPSEPQYLHSRAAASAHSAPAASCPAAQ